MMFEKIIIWLLHLPSWYIF